MILLHHVFMTLIIFSLWYFIGLGPISFFLPRLYLNRGFLLAPLMGMCLLILIGFFELTVSLSPITPHLNVIVLLILSLLLCVCSYKSAIKVFVSGFKRPLNCLWILPLTLIIFFSILFNQGYHLLVGSSDQLQYCLDAKQILEEIHTLSPNDLPIPRHDHYIYDQGTRLVPYSKNYRRGADILLAQTKSLVGLSYQETFPLVVLCCFMTLGLILGFIGRSFLRLSIFSSFILQFAFLSSFYLTLIHVQGSLALIVSLAPSLVSMAFLLRAIQRSSWRWSLLAALVLASYFVIYAEVIPVNILAPIGIMLLGQLRKSLKSFYLTLKNLLVVSLLTLLSAPNAINPIIFRIIDNLRPIFSTFFHPHVAGVNSHPLLSFLTHSSLQQWSLVSVVLGLNSYYDQSAFNAHTAVYVANHDLFSPAIYFFFCGLAFIGFRQNKTLLARFYAIPLILWPIISIIMADTNDGLRFARSLYYMLPFMIIGLVIFINTKHNNNTYSFTQKSVLVLGKLSLISFMIMNIYADKRTLDYLASHNVSNDVIISRFDENSYPWLDLKSALRLSCLQKKPFLISDFKDTIKPLIIVSNVPDQSHVLGTSLLSFWPIYTSLSYQPEWKNYNTRLTKEEFNVALARENKFWTANMVPNLIEQTQQAVVPVGNGIPSEWKSTSDIYPLKMKRFINVCDVMYRNNYSAVLPKEDVSALLMDIKGPYRMISQSSRIILKEGFDYPQKLTIFFEGNVNDIKIKNGTEIVNAVSDSNQNKIISLIQSADKNQLTLLVNKPVKLREMRIEPSLS